MLFAFCILQYISFVKIKIKLFNSIYLIDIETYDIINEYMSYQVPFHV
jgi:hypothetical protein